MAVKMEPVLNFREPESGLALPYSFRLEVNRWRVKNKISWPKLGHAIGSSPSTITAVLKGYQMCSYQVIRRLVAVSGVPFVCDLDTIMREDDAMGIKLPAQRIDYNDILDAVPVGVAGCANRGPVDRKYINPNPGPVYGAYSKNVGERLARELPEWD